MASTVSSPPSHFQPFKHPDAPTRVPAPDRIDHISLATGIRGAHICISNVRNVFINNISERERAIARLRARRPFTRLPATTNPPTRGGVHAAESVPFVLTGART